MGLSVEQLDPKRRSGVRINGLTEADLASPDIVAELRALWVQHGLIFFAGAVSPEFHIAVSQVFGEVLPHPSKEYQVEGNPLLLNARFDPDDTDIWEIDGVQLGAWTPWHSDLVCHPKINRGGILRPHHVAEEGGATAYIDKIEAYDTLPQDMKDRIEDFDVVYRHRIDFREQLLVPRLNDIKLIRTHPQRIESMRAREDRDMPPVVHPLVFQQPETGRKVLNFSPAFAERIPQLDKPESDDLLWFLAQHITNPDLAYVHHWQSADEMVLWDNWRTLHQAEGCPATIPRVMYRTTISGDYGRGKRLSDYEMEQPAPAMA